MWFGYYILSSLLVYIRRFAYFSVNMLSWVSRPESCKFLPVLIDVILFTSPVQWCFLHFYTRDLFGLITPFLRRPGGDAVWQPRYQTLTRHAVSLNTPCLISSCTPPWSVKDFWWQRWDNLISNGVKSGVASISRSPEIPDQPNCTLVNDNNSDWFSLQEIFFVGVEYSLQEWFFLL